MPDTSENPDNTMPGHEADDNKTTGKAYGFADLVAIMQALRDPATGCPWDVRQDFASIAPYTIEEAYEVADTIERGDIGDLVTELGDLLLQIVFHAQIGADRDLFTIDDVIAAICRKMIRRHPHVFAGKTAASAGEVEQAWEAIKDRERRAAAASSGGTGDKGALSGIARALPALMRAEKLQKRAARTGFDWPDPAPVLAKIAEEMAEVQAAMAAGDADGMEEEIGDFLFVAANLARHLRVNPEAALRRANDKFVRRFRGMEALAAADGQIFDDLDLQQQEKLWQRIKKKEKQQSEKQGKCRNKMDND